MPAPYIKKLSDKYDIPITELEKLWDEAKELAKDQDHENDWDYITTIFKKLFNGKYDKNESLQESTLKQWIIVGGIAMLLYNYLAKSKILMKKVGVKYGDIVQRKYKNTFGKNVEEEGLLIKKDGGPMVLIKSQPGITRFVRWTEEWKKKG